MMLDTLRDELPLWLMHGQTKCYRSTYSIAISQIEKKTEDQVESD